MGRLVVFGCSNTYGQGLLDPKKEVWGALLANLLKREFVNNGKPGASNKYIAHAINEFVFKPDDVVIIAWSYLNRSCVLYEPLTCESEVIEDISKLSKNISANLARQKNEDSVMYFKHFYNDFDSEFTNAVFMDFSIDLLISKKIEFRQLFVHPKDTPNPRHKDTNSFSLFFKDFYDRYPKAADKSHMGEQGNSVLAKAMYNELINLPFAYIDTLFPIKTII